MIWWLDDFISLRQPLAQEAIVQPGTKERIIRISNSFTEGEIAVLEFLLSNMRRGGDPKIVMRRPEFASLSKKVLAMRAKAEQERGRPYDPILLPTAEGPSVVAGTNGQAADDSFSA